MISISRILSAATLALLVGCAAPLTAPPPASQDPIATSAAPTSPTTAIAVVPETRPDTRRQAPVAAQPRVYPTGPLAPLTPNDASPLVVATLTPPGDLWERIRRGYAMPDLDNDLVRDRERWYVSRPDYIERMTERSRKYLFHIVEELERRNMPTELALLPFIESAFNPQAVSSAKAAGMWQFMPATGKYFELKQNAFRDDRRDVLASTRAALDYLQKLHRMFGDWHLALAAYNWGEGSVGRAIEKNRKAGLPTGYEDLKMPGETRLYVPKLQAVKNIVSAPQRLGANLPVIENHPFFQSVDITRDIDVAVAAKLAQVAIDDFRALNPSANRPVIVAAVTPQILLPWDNAAVFRASLRANPNAQLSSWTAWRATSTMRPADVAQRFGMSESELRSVNQIPAGMMIKTGSTLLVARGAEVRQDVAETVADGAQLSLVKQELQVRRVVRARKGESVASLARRYGVSATSLSGWNKVAVSTTFKAGQSVTVYLPARSRSASKAVMTAATKQPARRSKAKPVKVARD